MMRGKISSLVICVFVLITIFHFFPRCLSARNLAESPGTNDSGVEYEEDNDQSKSGVHGSTPRHSGSATNDNVPENGVVDVPPPTPIQRVMSGGKNGTQSVQNNGNGNGVVTSSNSNGDQSVVGKHNGVEGVSTRDGEGGHSVVSKNNGTEAVATRDKNGNQIVITRDKNGIGSITINNQTVSANGGGPAQYHGNAVSPPMFP